MYTSLGRPLLAMGLGVVAACLVLVPLLHWVHPECRCQSGGTTSRQGHALDAPIELLGEESFGATAGDVKWVKGQLRRHQVGDLPETENDWHQLRKGINPRTREQQLADLRRYKGISHYEGHENQTALLCPGELLVEQHHSNYGEPWAGGRDVFEFLARATGLKPQHRVLELGCGTLRVGLHFIRHLLPHQYHCLERDPLSLMAALMYELPAQGLLHKRPAIIRSADLNITAFSGKSGSVEPFDLIFASAAFLHMPDSLVWKGLESLGPKLALDHGLLFVSHNIKFCTRLRHSVCQSKLGEAGLEYVGKQTHDSFLFNHYEIWHKFRRVGLE